MRWLERQLQRLPHIDQRLDEFGDMRLGVHGRGRDAQPLAAA
jgi:hypothetical protein